MKVLLVAHAWPDEVPGGVALHVRALARELVRRGHQVIAVVGSLARAPVSTGERLAVERRGELEPGVDIRRLHRADLYFDHWHKGRNPAVSAELARILGEERPDVMHLHHWLRLSSDLVLTAARAGVPALVTLHDFAASCPLVFRVRPESGAFCESAPGPHPCVACAGRVEPRTPWVETAQGYVWFAERQLELARELDTARARIVPSRAHREALATFLGRDESFAEVLAPAHRTRAEALEVVEPPPAPPLILASWSGALRHEGLSLLLEALAAVRDRGREVELLLAGAPPAEALPPLPPWVRILGSFEPEALAGHPVTRAHALVSASLGAESYGLVHDEALQLGLPALLPESGAFRERAGRGARLYAAGDARSLAAAVEALFDPAEREGLRRAALAARAAVPAVEDVVERLLELYRGVARQGAPRDLPPGTWYAARLQQFALEQWDRELAASARTPDPA